jgi:restriction system protein
LERQLIPDYQSLMRPVLEVASKGEVKLSDAVASLADKLALTETERAELLPSGRQATFANRVHWAKTYLKQAGLLAQRRRGYFEITDRGRAALDAPDEINTASLSRFPEFEAFRARGRDEAEPDVAPKVPEPLVRSSETPDEALRAAHRQINDALAADLIDKIRGATPAFFEATIVRLLIAMGYGGSAEDAGRSLGRSGDDGVDGVIDQDPLGVDQIYVQAKRYAEGNTISSSAIRDFFGGLSLKKAQKGIFVTTSAFTKSAIETANALGSRIVLIDGVMLARLMIRYSVGVRVEENFEIKRIDEDFFVDD